MADPETPPVVPPPAGTQPAPGFGTPHSSAGAATPASAAPVVKPAAAATPAEPKRVRVKGDDDIPDDADLIEMSPRAMAARLARHSKSELQKRFGTDDPDKITADLKELEELRADKKKADDAKLNEVQLANKKAAEAEGRATAAEAKARQAEETRIYEKQEGRLAKRMGKHIDEDHVDVELTRFARHLTKTYDAKKLEAMSEDQELKLLEDWVKERVEAKPKIARDYEEKREAELRAELKAAAKLPAGKVTNGGKGGPPDGEKAASGEAKTFAPGKPNSYTDKEVKQLQRDGKIGRW